MLFRLKSMRKVGRRSSRSKSQKWRKLERKNVCDKNSRKMRKSPATKLEISEGPQSHPLHQVSATIQFTRTTISSVLSAPHIQALANLSTRLTPHKVWAQSNTHQCNLNLKNSNNNFPHKSQKSLYKVSCNNSSHLRNLSNLRLNKTHLMLKSMSYQVW